MEDTFNNHPHFDVNTHNVEDQRSKANHQPQPEAQKFSVYLSAIFDVQSAAIVTPTTGVETGVTGGLTITGGNVIIPVSETPRFVVVTPSASVWPSSKRRFI